MGAHAEGYEALFEELYRQHAGKVFRFCLRRTCDRGQAEDILSGVFYEAWRRRDEVDLATRDPLPWLYGVATNLLRNQRRSSRRREAAIRRVPRPTLDAGIYEDVLRRIDASTWARETLSRIQELPPGEREVVELCLLRNLSYAAAAAELGLPVGTVRSRLARARGRLHAIRQGAARSPPE